MSDTVHIVIPARREDPLFPNKILSPLNGKPLIWHVWQQAIAARLGEVTIACDDEDVFQRLTSLGMMCVMTAQDITNPYQRAAQALEKLGNMCEIVVVVPADIPQLSSSVLRGLIPPLWRADVDVSLLAWPEHDNANLQNPTLPKVVVNDGQRALYFSRCMIPYGANAGRCLAGPAALRRDTLNRLVEHKPSTVEREENIFWLRAFELNLNCHIALLDKPLMPVQVYDDLQVYRT